MRGCDHLPDGVGTRWPEADVEQVERADPGGARGVVAHGHVPAAVPRSLSARRDWCGKQDMRGRLDRPGHRLVIDTGMNDEAERRPIQRQDQDARILQCEGGLGGGYAWGGW